MRVLRNETVEFSDNMKRDFDRGSGESLTDVYIHGESGVEDKRSGCVGNGEMRQLNSKMCILYPPRIRSIQVSLRNDSPFQDQAHS